MTANELRIKVANEQRMKKTREKWLNLAERLSDIECWQEKTSYNGVTIGDRVGFIDTKILSGGCISMSQKYGVAFAFGQTQMVVIYRGELKRVRFDNE